MVMINKMNKYALLFALCAAITACTSEEISKGNELVQESSELSCEAKPKVFANEESSRSTLSLGATGMEFVWDDEDWITVFAKDDDNAKQLYRLISGGGEPNAKFSADNFTLKKSKVYYAFSKDETQNKHVTIPNQDNVLIDYSGQIQVGNGSTTHLGEYDFMVAGIECSEENSAHFLFDHLGATLRVTMDFAGLISGANALPDGDEKTALSLTEDQAQTTGALSMTRFTEMEVYDSENSFRQTNRYFSFNTGTSSDGGKKYTFKWPEQEITGMDRFKLTLKNSDEAANPASYSGHKGITRNDVKYLDGKSNSSKRVRAYMEIPPADFTNKTIGIMLKGYYAKYDGTKWVEYPVSYVSTYDSGWIFDKLTYEVLADRAYAIGNLPMEKPKDFKVSLKINHMWQHGSTLDNSRATGDPGYDKEIVTPSHIYYIYCHDGKVVKPTSGAASFVTHIQNATWDTKNNNGVYISTFKSGTGNTTGIITLDKPDCKKTPTKDANCEYHLYVVASKEAIPESYFSTVVANASEETVVRALKYDLPGTVSGTDKQPASDIQVFMRDLYSTPWDDVSFVGDLTDPIQDVILYHVAAKVDLEWNSTTAIKNVSVNSVKNSGLYMFQPTMNVHASGSYTETKNLTTDVNLWYNGRTSFYLPQYVNSTDPSSICKYNVTLGSGPEDITFDNLSTEGGFTSWLRWLKQK